MSIQSEPHFEVPSTELAEWIEKQGTNIWWSVDGDPFLTERVMFPCPGDELADALRRFNRSLLIIDPKKRQTAQGQIIRAAELDSVVYLMGSNVQYNYDGEKPLWMDDRVFCCRWKDAKEEWLLMEDRQTTKSNELDESALRAKE